MTLRSNDSIEVLTGDLPCGSHYSTTWVAIEPGGAPLEHILPVEDPGPGITVIKPGQVLKGRVDLRRHFTLPSARRELVIFWTYRLRTEDGRTSNRVGGWLPMR
jgi:hypothetical protein